MSSQLPLALLCSVPSEWSWATTPSSADGQGDIGKAGSSLSALSIVYPDSLSGAGQDAMVNCDFATEVRARRGGSEGAS
jgi:hypothetical protein